MTPFNPSRSRCRRRGVASLIEVLASMTMMTVLFGTTASLTVLLFRLERLGRDDLAATITEGKLASDLRSDVHASLSIDREPNANPLTMIGPGDRKVRYQVDDHTITRKLHESDGVERLETYRLRPRTLARWSFSEPTDPPRVSLILESPHTTDGAPRVFRIEATLGRDHRFEEDGS